MRPICEYLLGEWPKNGERDVLLARNTSRRKRRQFLQATRIIMNLVYARAMIAAVLGSLSNFAGIQSAVLTAIQ